MLMRLSIDIESLPKEFVAKITAEIERQVPGISARNRNDYDVLAIIGNIDEMKKIFDVLYPLLKDYQK